MKPLHVTVDAPSQPRLLPYMDQYNLMRKYLNKTTDEERHTFINTHIAKGYLKYLINFVPYSMFLKMYNTDVLTKECIFTEEQMVALVGNSNEYIEVTNCHIGSFNFSTDRLQRISNELLTNSSTINLNNCHYLWLFVVCNMPLFESQQVKLFEFNAEIQKYTAKRFNGSYLMHIDDNNETDALHTRVRFVKKIIREYMYLENNKLFVCPSIIQYGTININNTHHTKYCYICKSNKTATHFENYHRLCYKCGGYNYFMRNLKADLSNVRAYVSGCRHTIGYFTCLQLLRMGAFVVGSSRFIDLAAYNYQQEPDYAEFKDRLVLVECDFLKTDQVNELIEYLKTQDINVYINNAFQTIRQSPTYYDKIKLLQSTIRNTITNVETNNDGRTDVIANVTTNNELMATTTTVINCTNTSIIPQFAPSMLQSNDIVINEHRNLQEVEYETSWTQRLHETDPCEIIEGTIINQIIPTLLIKTMLTIMKPSSSNPCFIINVTSTEGNHHTALHNVTGSHKVAMDNLVKNLYYEHRQNMYTFNVDPGFVTGVFQSTHKPLSSLDGAQRVLHPIIQHYRKNPLDLKGYWLKDYEPKFWIE